MSVALNIIAKDQVDACKGIVTRYAQYFDEINIAIDDQEAFNVLSAWSDKIKLYKYEWINDFSAKRNFLADVSECEFYFRMDTDDEIENPDILKDILKVMQENNFDVFYVPYIYAKDAQGNCIAKHWRETIIRKKPGIFWKKPIHENVFIENPDKCKILRDDRLKLIHNIDGKHAVESYERNFNYLMDEFKKDKENTDPRTIAYLGRMFMAKGMWSEAVLFLENLVKRSGWDDDKYFAWIQMAQCYHQMGKHEIAIGCCNEALTLNTKFPDAFLQMGAVYLSKQDYEKAVDWIMPGLVRPEPDTVMVIDPTFYGYKAKINAALALLGKGDYEKALKYYIEAKTLAPKEDYVISMENIFKEAWQDDKYLKNLAWSINYILERDKSKVTKLIESMPTSIFKDERASLIRNQFLPPKTWARNTIVMYCGQAWEDWASPSVLKGIGGSEEAVIYLSKELTKLGYKVVVFNSCGDMEGEYDGVEYRPFYAFNPNDTYNIIIGWRSSMLGNIKAKQRIIWLHDVPSASMFPLGSENDFEKIIVLSEFHKTLLPKNIPEDKIFVSTNGINSEDFKLNGLIRNPHRVIYTSSYDRGLQHLLEIWGEVRKSVTDAELHIFYGWNTYDKMVNVGSRPIEYKNAMVALMNQPGVFEHGRVGHKQLNKEFQMSGVWAYPSHFEEISCISAMKAQANGCVPVCTDYAALSETVKTGVKIKGRLEDGNLKEFKEKLIETLDEKQQQILREEVLKHKDGFGWDKVAQSWKENLLCV